MPYFEVSARSNYNFEKPFLYLIRQFTGDHSLQFAQEVAKLPPEIPFDAAAYEEAVARAAATPLEEDDKDEEI
jgi:GTP-binding nuclear protein Ran